MNRDPSRPDADALLAHVAAEEAEREGGRLEVFFGAAPGVGKTYAMLEAARARGREGVDVVVGVVETHGREPRRRRIWTDSRCSPAARVEHRGITLRGVRPRRGAGAPARGSSWWTSWRTPTRPGAGTPSVGRTWRRCWPPGSMSSPRSTSSTSRACNDVVARITGVVVRETVPDTILERRRRGRARRPPPGGAAQAARGGEGLRAGAGAQGAGTASSARATSSRCVSSRSAARRSAWTPT